MTRKNHYGALHTDGETEGKEAQSIRNEGGATETEYRNLPGSPAVKALRFQCRRARGQSRVRKLSSHMPCSMAKKLRRRKKKKTKYLSKYTDNKLSSLLKHIFQLKTKNLALFDEIFNVCRSYIMRQLGHKGREGT